MRAPPAFVRATRAREGGLNNIVVRQADMDALPFADESFDVVTSRLGIMFSPNAERALSEARRVLRPGGTAAFLVWGSSDQPLFTIRARSRRAWTARGGAM